MKRGFAAASILMFGLGFGVVAFAQNASFSGTWKLDAKQSDFGSEPGPRSVTVTVKETQKALSVHSHGIDAEGKSFSWSWNGPEDGSLHPIMSGGKAEGKMSARKEGDTLLRHSEDLDGSSDYRATLSSDGNTATEEMTTKSKDGKETKGKTVWHRVSSQNNTNHKSH
jgi:hypothetical protein